MSLLDLLFPHVDNREILIVGETNPSSMERMLLAQSRLKAVMQPVRMESLDRQGTRDVARRWAEAHRGPEGTSPISEEVLSEAVVLAGQYLGDKAAPGHLLQLLELTRGSLDGAARPIV